MNWISMWVNSFMKKINARYTFADGVKSVLFSSLIIGALNFISSLFDTTTDTAASFATNLLLFPAMLLVCLFVFAAVFRWVAKMDNGKGSFKKDCAVFGAYFGSLIFMAGLIMFVMGLITTAAFYNADASSINYFAMMLVMGLTAAMLAYVFSIVFGLWLHELAIVEKLSMFSTAKAFGLATAIIIIAAALIFGALLELSLGPYKSVVADSYTNIGA